MALPEGIDAILKLLEESLPFAGIPSFMKRDHTKEIREGDAVDAASAPGTGSPVPGGPTTGEVRRFLEGLEGIKLVAADLVEVNPLYDPTQVTAIAAAFLALDLLYPMAAAPDASGFAVRATPNRSVSGGQAESTLFFLINLVYDPRSGVHFQPAEHPTALDSPADRRGRP